MGEIIKPDKDRKERRTLSPLDISIALRTEGTCVQLRGTLWPKLDHGHYAVGGKTQVQIWAYSEDAAFVVEEKKAFSVR